MHAEKNRKAFLTMIAVSEGTAGLGDNGYNVLYGGGLFTGYADHPRLVRTMKIKGKMVPSSAAGRYQILARYYDSYRHILSLPDFSPASQDAIALRMMRECIALMDVDVGRIEQAIRKCASRWASFPGAGYKQHEQKLQTLLDAYVAAGGQLA